MAIQTFTAAQVLTAAQMNSLQANDYNQTVSAKVASYTLVAADKGTRITMSNAAATTITVNTSLFAAGDSLRIQNIGAGACTITAGTATVTSAGPLALVQWAGGQLFFTSASAAVWFPDAVTAAAGALTCVKAQTTQTGASRVELDNIFSATYRNYLILIEFANAANTIELQVNASGTPVTTGTYARQAANASAGTASADRATAQTSGRIAGNGVQVGAIKLWLYAPFIATPTNYLSEQVNNDGNYQTPIWHNYYGNNENATSYSGVDILSSTTFDSTITCYGFGITL